MEQRERDTSKSSYKKMSKENIDQIIDLIKKYDPTLFYENTKKPSKDVLDIVSPNYDCTTGKYYGSIAHLRYQRKREYIRMRQHQPAQSGSPIMPDTRPVKAVEKIAIGSFDSQSTAFRAKRPKRAHVSKAMLASAVIGVSLLGVGFAAISNTPMISEFTPTDQGKAAVDTVKTEKNSKSTPEPDQVYGVYLNDSLVCASHSQEELQAEIDRILAPYQLLQSKGVISNFTLNVQPEIKEIPNAKLGSDTDLGSVVESGQDKLQIQDGPLANILLYGSEPVTYTVKEGDTLSGIAKAHGVSVTQLMLANPSLMENNTIVSGKTLTVSQLSGALKFSFSREVTESTYQDFDTVRKETAELNKGETKVSQKGKKGESQITTRYDYSNNGIVGEEQVSSAIISQPVNQIILVGTKEKAAAKPSTNQNNNKPSTNNSNKPSNNNKPSGGSSQQGSGQSTGTLRVPVSGTISSDYGERGGAHHGIDYAANAGTPIYAADGGTVIFSAFGQAGSGYGGYGNVVVIDHGDGMVTMYAHNSANLVSVGTKVSKGQLIAKVGSTGDSSGNHLHFEVRMNGKAVNPHLFF